MSVQLSLGPCFAREITVPIKIWTIVPCILDEFGLIIMREKRKSNVEFRL